MDDLFCHRITYTESETEYAGSILQLLHGLQIFFFFLQAEEGSDMQPASPGSKMITFGRQLCVLWL